MEAVVNTNVIGWSDGRNYASECCPMKGFTNALAYDFSEVYGLRDSKFFATSWIKGQHIGRRQLSLQIRDTVVQLKNGGVGFA